MTRDELLQKLTEMDFMAVDLALYLDTHPEDAEAIAAYRQVIAAADTLRLKYEESYGPLCSFRSDNASDKTWQWIDAPWPWQKDFNPSMAGKECV